jgi:transcriptional regulator with XRE-family HTH domain
VLDKSQEYIARELGLTFQQVQKYEKGANRISASRMQHLCKVLNVPVSFFFEDVRRAAPTPVEDGEALAMNTLLAIPDGIALVSAYRRAICCARRADYHGAGELGGLVRWSAAQDSWGVVATKPVRASPKTMIPAAAIDPKHMNVSETLAQNSSPRWGTVSTRPRSDLAVWPERRGVAS